MADDKSPECDGFPCEFYKHLQEYIGLELHKFYLEAYHSKSLGAIINKGNIKFIPKASDPDNICNWKLITLFVEAISLKIHQLLPLFVWPQKTGFIKSSYILDNIIVDLEGMEWAHNSNQPSIFLKFDFSKFYDQVEWPFISNGYATSSWFQSQFSTISGDALWRC